MNSMEEALRLHEAGKISEAAGLYRSLLEAHPEAAVPRHFLGIALFQLGDAEGGLASLRQAVAMEPGKAEWWNALGNVLTALKRLDEAGEAFTRATEAAPRNDSGWSNLGSVHQRRKRYAEAEDAYLRALSLRPKNIEVLNLLASLMNEQDRKVDAARFHSLALIAKTGEGSRETFFELGKARLILGEVDGAAEVYRRWLAEEPENPTPRHLLAACSGHGVPEKCSADYVEQTFDAFSQTFEEKLGDLSYRGPEMIGELLESFVPPGTGGLDVLDACCGTGLCGPFLKPFSGALSGVDLSQGMLDQARRRGLYGELAKAEAGDYLRARPGAFDLIACGDALIYFGNLAPLFADAASALRPGGLFLCTIEAADDGETFRLNPTGRYCHGRDYVSRVASAAGLEVLEFREGVLRFELGLPVRAWAAAIRRTAVS